MLLKIWHYLLNVTVYEEEKYKQLKISFSEINWW